MHADVHHPIQEDLTGCGRSLSRCLAMWLGWGEEESGLDGEGLAILSSDADLLTSAALQESDGLSVVPA
jgi:hypothetical protein